MKAWTDYPIEELGDAPYQEAPIREVRVLHYDTNKYCRILVEGVETEVKLGYLYQRPGRSGEVKVIQRWKLRMPNGKPYWTAHRRRYRKTTFHFYREDDAGVAHRHQFDTWREAVRFAKYCPEGTEVRIHTETHRGFRTTSLETPVEQPSFSRRLKKRRRGRK